MIRVIAAAKTIFLHIEKAFRPRLVRTIAIDKKPLPVSVQSSVMTFIVMVMMLFFISLLLMAFLQPSISFEGLFSGIITCFSNVGPGLSEIGPTTTFNVISDPNKLILCLIMIIGRLELFAILVLFIPGFWRKFS